MILTAFGEITGGGGGNGHNLCKIGSASVRVVFFNQQFLGNIGAYLLLALGPSSADCLSDYMLVGIGHRRLSICSFYQRRCRSKNGGYIYEYPVWY